MQGIGGIHRSCVGSCFRHIGQNSHKGCISSALVAMFGVFLIVAFPAAESGSSGMDAETVSVQTLQRHGRKAYANGDMPLISNVSDLPVISDIYDEYDLKVVHNLSAGQMKSMQGVVWKIGWISGGLVCTLCL